MLDDTSDWYTFNGVTFQASNEYCIKSSKRVMRSERSKEVFKPIITPLQEMANRTSAQPNSVKEESPSIKQELPAEEEKLSSIKQELPAEEEELSSIKKELSAEEKEEVSTMRGEEDLISFHSTSENTFPTFMKSSPILQKKSDNLSNYLKMLSKNQTSTLDTIYGVRSLTSGLKIGDKPISFADDKIRVGNEQYEKIEILFKKRPGIGLVKRVIRETTNKSFETVMLTENS